MSAAAAISAPEPRANPELYGQAAALRTVFRALETGRLPHGWLLSGPAGIGKATFAYRFARALLAGPETADQTLALEASHPVFRLVAQNAHPDLRVVEPERDQKTGKVKAEIGVDAVRPATAALHATAAMGGWRVILVDGADQLNRNAANALLKSLEEPPPRAVLILTTAHPARLPATVRSRCAKLSLARLPDETVAEGLARHAGGVPAEQRLALVGLAHGSLGRALDLAGGDWLPLYRRLALALGARPVDRQALLDLAQDLARHAESRSFAAPLGLIQELLGRAVAAGTGRLGAPLFEEERDALGALAGGRPLDRLAALWDKIGRLAATVDGLNLDRSQALLSILTLLATGAGQGGGPSAGPRADRKP